MSKTSDTQPEPPKKLSAFERFKKFILHATVWRFVSLAVAAIFVVLTGGAAVPIITLCAVFATSLISVIAKAVHVRRLAKYKIQNEFCKAIAVKYKELRPLKELFKSTPIKNKPLTEPPDKHQYDVSQEDPKTAAAKVLRDVGLENLWPVALFAATGNVVGTVVYVTNLVLGLNGIRSEFQERKDINEQIQKSKQEINAHCDAAFIPKSALKTTDTLVDFYKEEMIELETLKKLESVYKTKYLAKGLSEDLWMQDRSNHLPPKKDLTEEYNKIHEQVVREMEFQRLPAPENMFTSLEKALNPFEISYAPYVKVREGITEYTKPTRSSGALTPTNPSPAPTRRVGPNQKGP